jgi:hypothetical protein
MRGGQEDRRLFGPALLTLGFNRAVVLLVLARLAVDPIRVGEVHYRSSAMNSRAALTW